jgi:hypothetical protein
VGRNQDSCDQQGHFGRTTSNPFPIPKQLEEAVKNPAQFVGKFGIMNRKHRCRISKRHVRDECSTKRLVKAGLKVE